VETVIRQLHFVPSPSPLPKPATSQGEQLRESDTADRLMQESPKARGKGKNYAVQTVRQAAEAVERQRQEQPIHRSVVERSRP
jgi:hypothetical protein